MEKIKIGVFELSQTELVVFVNNLKISQVEKNKLFELVCSFCEKTVNGYLNDNLEKNE